MNNYVSEYIQLNLEDNVLKCKLLLPGGLDCPVVAYGLLYEGNKKAIIEEYSNNAAHQFKIKKNGKYQIRVYYKNEIPTEKNKSFTSNIIDISLNIPTPKEVRNSITISKVKNRIIFDFSNVLCSEVADISISYGNEVITKKVNREIFSYVLPQSDLYKLKLSYIDYNGNLNSVEDEIYATLEINNTETSQNVVLKKRIELLFHIIFAFIIREFQRKYDKGYFRYFSIILGPSVQLIIMVTIFTLMGKKAVVGLSIPIFVLTGLLPYGFFTTAGNCLTIVSSNRSLLSYKQVKIIDTILSSILMELMVTTTIFSGGIFICWYLGLRVVIYNPLSLLLSFSLLFCLTLGLALILSVVGFYFAEFNYAIQVIFRALFYVSGVFFSIENIPVQYQKYLLWNPLLQLVEYIRFSFVEFDLPYELSYLYLFKCTLIIFLLGLSLYFINRNKFMVNDRAR